MRERLPGRPRKPGFALVVLTGTALVLLFTFIVVESRSRLTAYSAAGVLVLVGWAASYRAWRLYQENASRADLAARSCRDLEMRVAERTLALEAVDEISAILSRFINLDKTSLDETLRALLDSACQALGTGIGCVFLDNGSGSLDLFCKTDALSEEHADLLKSLRLESLGPGLEAAGGRAMRDGRPVVLSVNDLHGDPAKRKLLESGARTIVSVPVILDAEVAGAIRFEFRGEGRTLAHEDARFLTAVSRHAAQAVRTDGLRREAESARKEWGRTFHSIMDPICVLDREGRIARANAEFARYIGRSAEEIEGRSYSDFFQPSRAVDTPKVQGHPPRETHEEITDPQGRTFLASSIPVFDDGGGLLYTLRLATEISAIKAAEEMLREEADASSALVQLSEVINSFLDKEHLMKEVTAIAPQYIKTDALGIFLASDGPCFHAGGFGFTLKERESLLGLLNGRGTGMKGLRSPEGGNLDEMAKEAIAETARVGDVAAMPILHKHEFMGVLVAASRNGREIGHRDRGLLKGLSNSLAASLKNAALYAQTEELFLGAVKCLTSAVEAKSPWTRGHSERVTMYAIAIGKSLNLDGDSIRKLTLAALLHDVGKIGTFDSILDKPGDLTEEEYRRVQLHPHKGAEIVAGIRQLKDVAEIIKYHHERPDGTGYPDGLAGRSVPVLSRIIAVADAYDSMTSVRPYRETPGREYALSELRRCSGTQFDSGVVDAFFREFGTS
jgi:PAS domain S-box-containing protein/putative nucleotidyltransferase with HDIG domain